mmetsp:Transcript_34342/g.95849  ORF Transcript_34342/g.95849 Transcript_34342/m.95849 type:complete len:342 (-) Transcript_34342:160-1185(-)
MLPLYQREDASARVSTRSPSPNEKSRPWKRHAAALPGGRHVRAAAGQRRDCLRLRFPPLRHHKAHGPGGEASGAQGDERQGRVLLGSRVDCGSLGLAPARRLRRPDVVDVVVSFGRPPRACPPAIAAPRAVLGVGLLPPLRLLQKHVRVRLLAGHHLDLGSARERELRQLPAQGRADVVGDALHARQVAFGDFVLGEVRDVCLNADKEPQVLTRLGVLGDRQAAEVEQVEEELARLLAVLQHGSVRRAGPAGQAQVHQVRRLHVATLVQESAIQPERLAPCKARHALELLRNGDEWAILRTGVRNGDAEAAQLGGILDAFFHQGLPHQHVNGPRQDLRKLR